MKPSEFIQIASWLVMIAACIGGLWASNRQEAQYHQAIQQIREAETQLSHERQYTARLSQILSQQESRKQLTPAHASHE
jgi:hypothetical protein